MTAPPRRRDPALKTPFPLLFVATWSALISACLGGCSTAASTSSATVERDAPATVYRVSDARDWPGDVVLPLRTFGAYRFIDAQVNGEPAGRFLLDTGANRTVIDSGVAGRLGLPDDGGGQTIGVAGTQQTRYRLAEHVRLGPGQTVTGGDVVLYETQRKQLIGLSLRNLGSALNAGVGGIAGFTDFSAVPFTIDPQAGTLTLHHPQAFRPPPDTTRHRLYRFQGLPVIDAKVQNGSDALPVRLLLDTGANGALTLPRTLLQRYPRIASVPVSGAGAQSGVGGTVGSTDTWVRQTELLGLQLQHIPASFEQMPGALGNQNPPLGRLGMGILGNFRLTFDARRGYIYAAWLAPTTARDAR